jgi:hypothetical protein
MAAGIVGLGLLMVPTSALALADNYRAFRFDLGDLYCYLHKANGHGGGLVLEPMFNLTDRLSIGLRQEVLVVHRSDYVVDATGRSVAFSQTWLQTSYLLKGEFYFTKGTIRPFSLEITDNGVTQTDSGPSANCLAFELSFRLGGSARPPAGDTGPS